MERKVFEIIDRERILEDAPVMVALHDTTKRVVWANRSYLEQAGKSLDELMNDDCYTVMWRRDEPCPGCPVERAIKTGKPAEDEIVVELDTGRKSFWLVRAVPIKDRHNSNIIGAIKTAIQIPESLAEARVRASEIEEKFRSIFDESTDAIIIFDTEGHIQDCNPRALSILGLTKKDIIGKKLFDIGHFYPTEEPLFREKHIPGKRQKRLEKRLKLKENGEVITEEGLVNFRSGEKAALFHDITRQREIEDRVSKQFKTLKSLYEVAQKLAESLNQEGTAYHAVKACVEILGAKVAWLGRAEEDGRVKPLSQYPEDHPYPKSINVRWDNSREGMGPTGTAIRSSRCQIVVDIEKDTALTPWRHTALKHSIRSVMAIPLISRGHTFGALNLYSDVPGFFNDVDHAESFKTFAHLAAAALENARLMEESNRRIARITALRHIDATISGSMDIKIAYRVALDEIVHNLGVDAAAILRMNEHFRALEFVAGRGFKGRDIEKARVFLGEGPPGACALRRELISISDLRSVEAECPRIEIFLSENFLSYYAAPMVAKGRLLGVLEVFLRRHYEPDREWLDFLEMLANQIAIAVDNASMFRELERKHSELVMAYDATIKGWAKALEMREEETEEHCRRVTELSLELAKMMGVNEEDLVHVWRGALLHDIGKLVIPDAILLKPGKLTDEEWEVMKKHPVYAFEMLASIPYLKKALDIPYCHHEKWDGSGYPRGLKGKQIPLIARIFAVVDVWDALTSDRPYRKAWPEEKALSYIQEQSGKQFDPDVVESFLKLLKK